MENKKHFRYCVTPDCPIVYKISETPGRFRCPACDVTACTSCHLEYHGEMPCEEYGKLLENRESEKGFIEWINQDPSKRKLCPKCSIGIEKIEGCNKMMCASCKTIMCWVCMRMFPTVGDCYEHLSKSHGSLY